MMRKGREIAVLAGGTLATFLLVVTWWVRRPEPERPLEPVRFCEATTVGVLGTIAKDKEFFRQQGLDVSMSLHPFGRVAMNAMFAGDCDIAQAFETPVMFTSFRRNDFAIIATTSSASNYGKIVARKDRGVRTAQELRGKRIGAMKETTGHFFLYRFLTSHGLNMADVEVVFPESIEALREGLLRGDLDAVSLWEPDASALGAQLTDTEILFSAPDLVLNFTTLIVRRDFFERYPHRISAVLKAFLDAEQLLNEDRSEAIRSVFNITGAPVESISRYIESQGTIRVALDQALLLTLEDEAIWAMGSGLEPKGAMPNFLAIVNFNALEAVKPAAVTILR